ncbi:hypothetical protein GCM10020331_098260 [Ectobacillus funiculus]
MFLVNMYDLHKTTEAYSPNHERILINFKSDYIQRMANGMEESFLRNISEVSCASIKY